MTFNSELDFEKALIETLTHKGWNPEIIKYPTEEDLIRNWANILFENNRSIDRLGDYPLTTGEMQQLIEQITALRTPLQKFLVTFQTTIKILATIVFLSNILMLLS